MYYLWKYSSVCKENIMGPVWVKDFDRSGFAAVPWHHQPPNNSSNGSLRGRTLLSDFDGPSSKLCCNLLRLCFLQASMHVGKRGGSSYTKALIEGLLRESTPRRVDKKSRVPYEEKRVWGSRSGDRGLEFSRRRKRKTPFFFPSAFLSLSHIKHFFL